MVAQILHGIVAYLNTIVPVVLYFTWKQSGNSFVKTQLYYWAWMLLWVSSLVVWSLPALLFPFTFWGFDAADWLFLVTLQIVEIAPVSVYWVIFLLFLVSAAVDTDLTLTSGTERWIVAFVYLTWASGTSFVQIFYGHNLERWYLYTR